MSSSAQAGNIKLVRGRWNKDFLDELEQAGPDEKLYDHDDQWDAAASAFNHLARISIISVNYQFDKMRGKP